jgi:hypothetical protein
MRAVVTRPRLAAPRSSRLRRRVPALCALALLTAAASVPALLVGTTNAGDAAGSQIPGSVAAPSASEVSPVCTAPDPSVALGPQPSLPQNPAQTLVSPPGGVIAFVATASNLYVNTGSQMVIYTLSGTEVRAFSIPSAFANSQQPTQPVVDPSGNIYLGSYYGTVVDKFTPTGALAWSVDPGHPVGLFPIGTGSSFALGVSVVEHPGSSTELNLATGASSGSYPLYDDVGYVTQAPNGDDLYTEVSSSTQNQYDEGYVETVSPSGTVLSTFGSGHIEGQGQKTGSGTQFYYPGEAAMGPDGTVYTADPLSTIEATSPQGYLEGTTSLHNSLQMGGPSFFLEGGTFFFQGGPPFNRGAENISTVPLSAVTAYLHAVQQPDGSLGWGAGIVTPEPGNYFPPGTTPTLSASFDPWWTEDAAHLEVSYSIETDGSLTSETVPAPTTVPLPTSAQALASVPLPVPAADDGPGPYLVQASLYDTSTDPPTRLGTTCLPVTVGATGDNLDLSSLPPGAGSGGPNDPRGVALNAQLGLSGLRALAFSWSNYLPNCNASAPTAATCGPSAMTFTQAPSAYFQAAALAAADHVTYWVQVSGGDPVSAALVHAGFWQGDIAALVSYYSKVPAGCSPCAPVTNWEPWNEANNTGWSNAAAYVSQVLAPFYAAVKSVEPGSTSTVIGGSSLEPSVSWWQAIVGAGGLADMDVAAIHPYTGNNDAFEEDSMQSEVAQLQGVLAGKPLWFTEVGWWSDGDYDYLAQANNVARAMVWMKVLHVPVWSYFFDEGSWGNDGVTFSLIQDSNTDDYVKPAALATMEASSELAGRNVTGTPPTGIPQTYETTFSPTSGGHTQLAAVWTDGLPVTSSVTVTAPGGGTVPVTVVSEYGAATSSTANSGQAYGLPLSDEVTYVLYPTGDSLSVGPTESYGTNLALSSSGATASASSGNASAAISGLAWGTGQGWSSASGDVTPSLTVNLAGAPTVNRIVVDTQSNGSVAASLRNYTVSLDEPGSGWQQVSSQTASYRNHELQLAIPPTVATGVRVNVSEVNFGGYYGGGIPPWWNPTETESAFLHALQVYAGTSPVSVVDGSDLTPLTTGGSGGGSTTTTSSSSTTTTSTSSTTTTSTSTTTTTSTSTTTTTEPTTTTTTEPTTTTTTTSPGGSGHHGTTAAGYWLSTSSGSTYGFGNRGPAGPTHPHLKDPPVVGMAAHRGAGYWLVTADGGVYNYGRVHSYGSAAHQHLTSPVVGMAATPNGRGYWIVTSAGTVYPFGSAHLYSPSGSHPLTGPVVGMASSPDGHGYWLVTATGTVRPYGDALFRGPTQTVPLQAPIVGMAATSDGKGYWLVGADGGVFNFGDAPYKGSPSGQALAAPVVGLAPSRDDRGYWLAGADGSVRTYGDAIFKGSATGKNGRTFVAIW